MKITVIIPTRERADTLQHSLATVVTQNYAGLTILVSDNASKDNTRRVVESFKDPRIRYISPGKRLSMSHHWEFALRHVQTGYVMFIGDDDGIVPGGIERVVKLLAQHDFPDAVVCSKCLFFWENASAHYRNHSIPGRSLRFKLSDHVEWADSETMLRLFGAQKIAYQSLPCLYRGVVSISAINRAIRGEAFFRSLCPDIYSGVAVAAVTKRYLLVEQPFSIEGVSRNSTGLSGLSAQPASAQATGAPAAQFLAEDNIPWHPMVPKALLCSFYHAESIMQAKDAGLLPVDYSVDVLALLTAGVREVEEKPDAERKYFEEQLQTAAQAYGMALPLPVESSKKDLRKNVEFTTAKYYWRTGHISGRCPSTVATVADAAIFLNRFLRWRKLLLGASSLWRAGSRIKSRFLGKTLPESTY